MKSRAYLVVSAVIFGVVGLLHLWRLVGGVDVAFGERHVPMGGSVVGLVVAGALSIWGFSLARK